MTAKREIVGLVFDGNIHSIPGSCWFDAEKNRTVAVHPEFIPTALLEVYDVPGIAREIGVGESARRAAAR